LKRPPYYPSQTLTISTQRQGTRVVTVISRSSRSAEHLPEIACHLKNATNSCCKSTCTWHGFEDFTLDHIPHDQVVRIPTYLLDRLGQKHYSWYILEDSLDIDSCIMIDRSTCCRSSVHPHSALSPHDRSARFPLTQLLTHSQRHHTPRSLSHLDLRRPLFNPRPITPTI
jgi:hypothetical protein